MAAGTSDAGKPVTTTARVSDRELVVTRGFNAPAHLVFKAWTTPELVMQWWAPKSFCVTFISCEADYRTGGRGKIVEQGIGERLDAFDALLRKAIQVKLERFRFDDVW